MLKALRWKLTFFYFVVALFLIALVGGGSYWLLSRYFQQTTDMALQYRMAQELSRYGVNLPPEMVSATTRWCDQNQLPTPGAVTGFDDDSSEYHWEEYESFEDEAYNADLATIFVFPLDSEGDLLFDPNPVSPRVAPNREAAQEAIVDGCDWRTMILDDGRELRLFTYSLPINTAPRVLQVGRFMENTRNVLRTLMMGILGLAGFSTFVLGFGGWHLAGRSLKPAQQVFDQQQAFIANASHELRAPLTIIRATAEVGIRHAENDRQLALLHSLVEESDHMASLVEDLLLLSRLDAGKLKFEKEELSIQELFDSLVPATQVIMEKEGIVFEQSIQAAISSTIIADRTRLRQVLLILLINAIHHTPPGGKVQLSAQLRRKEICFIVEDTGEGIRTGDLPHVFERFYQADSSMGKENKGSGLGLSIAKSLIDAHGGTIGVESEFGKGTRVSVVLPVLKS